MRLRNSPMRVGPCLWKASGQSIRKINDESEDVHSLREIWQGVGRAGHGTRAKGRNGLVAGKPSLKP